MNVDRRRGARVCMCACTRQIADIPFTARRLVGNVRCSLHHTLVGGGGKRKEENKEISSLVPSAEALVGMVEPA